MESSSVGRFAETYRDFVRFRHTMDRSYLERVETELGSFLGSDFRLRGNGMNVKIER